MEQYDTEVEQLFLYSVIYPTFIYLYHCALFCMKITIKHSIDRSRTEGQVQSCPSNVQGLTALPHCRSCHPYTWHSVPRAHFSLTGTAAHGIPLHTLAIREGGHVGIGVHTLLHVAAPHALGAATGALSTCCPQGTRYPALLGAVVRWEVNTEKHSELPPCWLRPKSFQYGLLPLVCHKINSVGCIK